MWDDGDGDGEYTPSEEEKRAQEERGHTATHDPAYEALMSATRHEGLEARYSPRCVSNQDPQANSNSNPYHGGCTQKGLGTPFPRLIQSPHLTDPLASPRAAPAIIQRIYFCDFVCVRGRAVFVLGEEPPRESGVLSRPPMGETRRCAGPREGAVDTHRCADPEMMTPTCKQAHARICVDPYRPSVGIIQTRGSAHKVRLR